MIGKFKKYAIKKLVEYDKKCVDLPKMHDDVPKKPSASIVKKKREKEYQEMKANFTNYVVAETLRDGKSDIEIFDPKHIDEVDKQAEE